MVYGFMARLKIFDEILSFSPTIINIYTHHAAWRACRSHLPARPLMKREKQKQQQQRASEEKISMRSQDVRNCACLRAREIKIETDRQTDRQTDRN